MMTIEESLLTATSQLSHSDSARLDAELLLCEVLCKPRAYLYTWPEKELSDDEKSHFDVLLERRISGEPVAHIIGSRDFWTLSLKVTPDTLIPRPETEMLVEAALQRMPPEGGSIADLGTGSGAIALALASECQACKVVAIEQSPAALQVAEENARLNKIGNVSFLQGSWYEPIKGGRFDMIVSNPPYICDEDPHMSEGDVRFEPLSALSSGADGLEDIRHIVDGAAEHLEPGGWLLLEHGYDQGEAVCELLRREGFVSVDDLPDLQGHGRVAVGQLAEG